MVERIGHLPFARPQIASDAPKQTRVIPICSVAEQWRLEARPATEPRSANPPCAPFRRQGTRLPKAAPDLRQAYLDYRQGFAVDRHGNKISVSSGLELDVQVTLKAQDVSRAQIKRSLRDNPLPFASDSWRIEYNDAGQAVLFGSVKAKDLPLLHRSKRVERVSFPTALEDITRGMD